MAIVWACEGRVERTGSEENYEEKSKRCFYVQVDNYAHGDQWLKFNAAGQTVPLGPTIMEDEEEDVIMITLPDYMDAHHQNTGIYAKSIDVSLEKGMLWKLTYNYDNKPLNEVQKNKNTGLPKWEWPVEVEYRPTRQNRPRRRDRNGDPICNSAGDPYDPELMWPVTIRTWHCTKHFASYPTWVYAAENTTNNAAFTIQGQSIPEKGAAFINATISSAQWDGDTPYWTAEWDIEADPDGYVPKVLDQGLRQKVEGKLVAIKYSDLKAGEADREVSAPVLMNGSGLAQTDPTPTSAIFRDHEVDNEVSYGAIPGINGTA